MGTNLQITINKAACVSNQGCVGSAPGAFRLDADGKSEVISASGDTREAIVEAALNCPMSAISVVDADTGEDILN